MADRSAQLKTLDAALASAMARLDEIRPGEVVTNVYFGPYGGNEMNGFSWAITLYQERTISQPDRGEPRPIPAALETIRESNMAMIVSAYGRAVAQQAVPKTEGAH